MLDFGYTPEALLNNIELTGVDPSKIDALVVSHGHFDHFGGLQSDFSEVPRRAAGRREALCRRRGQFLPSLQRHARGSSPNFGALDRRELVANKVSVVLAENPTVVAGHAFTTGKIKRVEHRKGAAQYAGGIRHEGWARLRRRPLHSAELLGKIVPDEHIHEHATCFNVKDRGLVVISSCGHVGIVNSVRQAQEVSGVQKVHAIVGGFHLGPAPADYLNQVVAEIKKLEPDVVIPMHCSGNNFVPAVRAADAGQAAGLDHRQPRDLRAHERLRVRARRRPAPLLRHRCCLAAGAPCSRKRRSASARPAN